MKYGIGDVARTLGLTPAALHFFEREGVIGPKKGGAARRTYGAEDIIRLISYKKYRSMDMPLKEIARQFSPQGDTSLRIAKKLTAQREAALETALRYERLARDIQWFEQAIERASAQIGVIELSTLPECFALLVGRDGFISRDRAEQERVAAWLEHLPAVRISVFGQADGSACFGYTVSTGRARQLGLDKTPGAVRIMPHIALRACLLLPYAYYEQPAMAFEALWARLKEQGYRQAGMVVGVNLCVECGGSQRDTLCEVWLPVD